MTSRTALATMMTVACAAAPHPSARMPSYQVTGFQKNNDVLDVTLEGRAAPVRVPAARDDFVSVVARVADAYVRGAAVDVVLQGDELASIDGPTDDFAARPYTCQVPPGPPLFGFGTQPDGDVSASSSPSRSRPAASGLITSRSAAATAPRSTER
jgi:hypothetical protein